MSSWPSEATGIRLNCALLSCRIRKKPQEAHGRNGSLCAPFEIGAQGFPLFACKHRFLLQAGHVDSDRGRNQASRIKLQILDRTHPAIAALPLVERRLDATSVLQD